MTLNEQALYDARVMQHHARTAIQQAAHAFSKDWQEAEQQALAKLRGPQLHGRTDIALRPSKPRPAADPLAPMSLEEWKGA